MSNVTDTYKIQFVTRNINGKYRNMMNSTNNVLNQFIFDYKTPSEVNDFLITPLNQVINGTSSLQGLVSESSVFAQITSALTIFYQDSDFDPNSPPDFSLPTQDMLTIAEAWLNYISSITANV